MSNRSIRWLALSLLPLFANADPAEDAEPKIVVIDLRPSEEKEGTGLQELEGKCNADVYRIADVASDPLKVDVLREDLTQLRLSAPKTLTVLDWSIYYNKQVQGNKGTGLRSVGIQGYAIPGAKKERRAGSRCTRRDTAGGWYEGAELHSIYFPLISEFTGTYGGRPVTVRIVYSPTAKLTGKFEGAADDTRALLELVHQTSEQIADFVAR